MHTSPDVFFVRTRLEKLRNSVVPRALLEHASFEVSTR